ncbi:hypothetical protein BZG36_02128 [Bifiguratus adelaidae]|uniref:chitin synthase n=1 Tax=Bifiguratus adelaidae TaxID=1938954 RepID=A0A261Y332_9FUNG|nr:hypothetical protein BZG36_02128 [Bifiguratus adelaidae]
MASNSGYGEPNPLTETGVELTDLPLGSNYSQSRQETERSDAQYDNLTEQQHELQERQRQENNRRAIGVIRSTTLRHRVHPTRGSTLRQRPTVNHGERAALSRPERVYAPPPLIAGKKPRKPLDPWVIFCKMVTFWAPWPLMKHLGFHDKATLQAWREKITLCALIFLLGCAVAFFIVGLQKILCGPNDTAATQGFVSYKDPATGGMLGIRGVAYNISSVKSPNDFNFFSFPPGADITDYFQEGNVTQYYPECANANPNLHALTSNNCGSNNGLGGCPLDPLSSDFEAKYDIFPTNNLISYDWTQMALPELSNYFVLNGEVMNMDAYIKSNPNPIPNDVLDSAIRQILDQTHAAGGRDGTTLFERRQELKDSRACFRARYVAGSIGQQTPGCIAATVIYYVVLVLILSIVLGRFAMALTFSWFISHKLSRTPEPRTDAEPKADSAPESSFLSNSTTLRGSESDIKGYTMPPWASSSRISTYSNKTATATTFNELYKNVGNDLYTVILVTCYSEGEDSIRGTLESLAQTNYPDMRKLLFVVADGQIVGHGNDRSTPDICRDMMTFDDGTPEAIPRSYIAIAQGSKQLNAAKVYAGYFVTGDHKVPMILISKCGPDSEQDEPKPGNRGKRDSQMILMNFFNRVTFDDRMTPLDYELFRSIQKISNITPDLFELVLMVDADTKVYDTSLRYLVNCMVNDELVMGLCGETKIANKLDSWVTMIQVYEYYISHHLGKGFEALFGGVTCLPGCFCMYRIKARKAETGEWFPILVRPEIVLEYSQNVVETLHQKNLLLLGEDRFLSTLMLRTFPYRKMTFAPKAICKTVVPDNFKVLISQRRRWINSTIHNLLELILVRNLCGTFCFSMQFVIFMDLIGSLVLPFALVLTVVMIVSVATQPIDNFQQAIPLMLLIIILFSPGMLIFLTTRKWVYAGYMAIYLAGLWVWNFVLPVYAYWHFDDFSWGETRKVSGEKKSEAHGGNAGMFDSSKITLRKWKDWERHRIRLQRREARQLARRSNGNVPASNWEQVDFESDDVNQVVQDDLRLGKPSGLGSAKLWSQPLNLPQGFPAGPRPYLPGGRPTPHNRMSFPAQASPYPRPPGSMSPRPLFAQPPPQRFSSPVNPYIPHMAGPQPFSGMRPASVALSPRVLSPLPVRDLRSPSSGPDMHQSASPHPDVLLRPINENALHSNSAMETDSHTATVFDPTVPAYNAYSNPSPPSSTTSLEGNHLLHHQK